MKHRGRKFTIVRLLLVLYLGRNRVLQAVLSDQTRLKEVPVPKNFKCTLGEKIFSSDSVGFTTLRMSHAKNFTGDRRMCEGKLGLRRLRSELLNPKFESQKSASL